MQFTTYLDTAFAWCCQARLNYPAHDSIWTLRRDWAGSARGSLLARLRSGEYEFQPVKSVRRPGAAPTWVWDAGDAIVLKMLSLWLSNTHGSALSRLCTHPKGHGSVPAAVQRVHSFCADHAYVYRTDVKSYYESIQHPQLLEILRQHIADIAVLGVIEKFLTHLEDRDAELFPTTQGISKSCPLSPLLGAFYLLDLDQRMEQAGVAYVRYMDDIIIMAPTRWRLRKAMKWCKQIFEKLQVSEHPDKTSIGPVRRGFSFLGFSFTASGVAGLSEENRRRATANILKLYEQARSRAASAFEIVSQVRRYRQARGRWMKGVLGNIETDHGLAAGGNGDVCYSFQ